VARPGKVEIKDTDKGFRRMVAEMGEMGAVVIGVQGKEAEEKHRSSELTVGQVAAIHELGLSGGHRTQRSWLRSWMDGNQDRLVREARAELTEVLQGRTTRKKALIKLGLRWTEEVRDRIMRGEIRPALRESTIARKGHSTPLLETTDLVNAITYKVFLPALKSIRDTAQRVAARGSK
jgi:hypothetical protein